MSEYPSMLPILLLYIEARLLPLDRIVVGLSEASQSKRAPSRYPRTLCLINL